MPRRSAPASAAATATLRANRLIHGDNLDVMRALPNGCVDLAYSDPPFFTGARKVARARNGDAAHAFDDAWAGDLAGYVAWMSARLTEMRRLLSPRGVLYLHCDWHAGHYLKVEVDRIFGRERFQNEVVWHYGLGASNATRHFLRKHDTILVYARGDAPTFNLQRGDVTPAMLAKYCHEDEGGRYMRSRGKKYYLQGGKPLDSVWDIPAIAATSSERLGYPTQKPEALLERIVLASSNPGDVVADFFCGSGTTPAVAHRLGRRWLACDASAGAIDVTRARLQAIGAQFSESAV